MGRGGEKGPILPHQTRASTQAYMPKGDKCERKINFLWSTWLTKVKNPEKQASEIWLERLVGSLLLSNIFIFCIINIFLM